MRDVPHVDDVLLPQGLVESELLVVLGHHRVDVALDVAALGCLLDQLGTDSVAARKSRQYKIDRRGDPDDHDEEDQAADEVAESHWRGPGGARAPLKISLPLSRRLKLV